MKTRTMHLTRGLLLVLGLAGGGFFLAGCQKVNTVERRDSQAAPQRVDDVRVQPDRTLAYKFRVVEVIEGRNAQGLLRVQTRVRSTTRRSCRFRYRYAWVEEDGFSAQAFSTWRDVELLASQEATLTGMSPNPRVVDFRLEMVEED